MLSMGSKPAPTHTMRGKERLSDRTGERRMMTTTVRLPNGKTETHKYRGGWLKNQRSGFGELITPSGKYEGGWQEGKQHGEGTQWVREAGAGGLVKRYMGGWAYGQRHGRGTYFYEQGDRYVGEWQHGVREGQGTMHYASNETYNGTWSQDMRHGMGVLALPNGDSYEGGWLEDKKHGPGRYIYLSRGKMYEGEWVHGTAKAGVMSDLPVDAESLNATSSLSLRSGAALARALPELGLADPDAVITEAISNARFGTGGPTSAAGMSRAGRTQSGHSEARAAVPVFDAHQHADAASMDVPELSSAELDELMAAFAVAGAREDAVVGDSVILATQLPMVLQNLGLDPTEADLAALYAEMQLDAADPGALLPFSVFALCMAAHRE